MVPRLGKMPPFRKRGTSALDVPTHGEFSHRVGLGSSVPSEGCSRLGMTPWSLTSRGVNSLSDPISPLRGWLEAIVDTEPFSRLFPLATLQVDWFSGSVRVGLRSRKDALPGDLAGGRCPRPARVPAVQPSGHTLGAETQVLRTPHPLFCPGFKGRWVSRDCSRSRRDRSPGGWGRHVTQPE